MSSRIKRRVTLEKSNDNSGAPRKPSVFERLGPGANAINSRDRTHVDGQEICRLWQRHGFCSYGSTCRFYHGPTAPSHTESSRTKHSKVDKKYENFEKSKSKRKPKKEEMSTKEKKSMKSNKSSDSGHRSSNKKKSESSEGKIKSTVVVTRNTLPGELEGKRKEKSSWGEEDSEDWPVDTDQLDYKEEQMLERKRQQLKRELELEEEKEQFGKHTTAKHSPSSSTTSSSESSSSSDSSDSSSDSSSSSSSSSPHRKKKKKKSSKEPGEIREKKKTKQHKDPAGATVGIPWGYAFLAVSSPKSLKDRKSSKDAHRKPSSLTEEKKHSSKATSSYHQSKKSKERSDGGGHTSFNEKPDRTKRGKNKKKNFKASKAGHHSKRSIITGSNSIPLAKNRIKVQSPVEDKKSSKEMLMGKFQRPPSPHSPPGGRYHDDSDSKSSSRKRKERSPDLEQAGNKRIRMHSPQPSVTQRFHSPMCRVEEVTRTVRRRSQTPPLRPSRLQESPPPLKHKPPPRMNRDYDDGPPRSGYRVRSPPPNEMKPSRKDRGKPGRLHEDVRRYDRDLGRNSPIVIDRMPARSPDRPEKDRNRPLYRSDVKPPNRSLSPRSHPRLHARRSSPPDHLRLHDYPPPDYPLYPSSRYLDDRGPFSDFSSSDPLYNSSPYRYSDYPPPPSRKDSYLEPHERALLESQWSPRSRGPEDDWNYHCPPDSLLDDDGYSGRPRHPLPPRKGSDWPRHDPRERPFSPGRGPPPLSKGPKQEPGSWESRGRESRQDRKRDDSRAMDHRHDSDGRRCRRPDSYPRSEEDRPPKRPSPSSKSYHSKPQAESDRTSKSEATAEKPQEEKSALHSKCEADSKKDKENKKELSKKESVDDDDHIVEDYSDWTDEDADLDILTKEDEFVEVKEVTNDDDVVSELTSDAKNTTTTTEGNISKEENTDPHEDLMTPDCVDYDPISDEDFETMMEDNEEKPPPPILDTSSPSKEQSRIAMALQVDWSSLTGFKSIPEPVTSLCKRLSPKELLLDMGFSQEFAGPELTAKILDWLAPNTEEATMEHPVAAFHEIIRANKKCRERIFYNVGPFRKALCSRHDANIRRLLVKPLDKVDWSAKRELLK